MTLIKKVEAFTHLGLFIHDFIYALCYVCTSTWWKINIKNLTPSWHVTFDIVVNPTLKADSVIFFFAAILPPYCMQNEFDIVQVRFDTWRASSSASMFPDFLNYSGQSYPIRSYSILVHHIPKLKEKHLFLLKRFLI